MKTFVNAFAVIATAMVPAVVDAKGSGGGSGGSHSIRGYTTKNGTYVAPSHATNPNHTQRDNYTSKLNVNPYTGKPGTRESAK